MYNRKNIIFLSLITALCFLVLTGGGVRTVAAETNKVTLSVWSFTDEIKKFINAFGHDNPDVRLELTIVPCEEYLYKIRPVLRSGRNAPDVFLAEYSNVVDLVESGFYDDLGKAPYNARGSDVIPYVSEVGTDSGGHLRALSWQACVGGVFYRRSVAKKYLGTDDPEKVGNMLSTHDKFLQTARILKQKSNGKVKIIAGYGDYQHFAFASRTKAFVTDGRLNIEQATLDYFDMAKIMRDEDLTAEIGTWSPPWFENMNKQDPEFFCYILPTWGLQYVIKPNAKDTAGDWGLCRGPAPYFWGGTWIGIYKDSKHKKAAWKFVKFMTLDRDTQEWWAKETGDFITNKAALNRIKHDFNDELLAGQNHYEFYAREAFKIDGSLLKRYDLDIRGFLMGAINEYVEGTMTKAQALKQFKADVKNAFPDVMVGDEYVDSRDQPARDSKEDDTVLSVWSYSNELEDIIYRFEREYPGIDIELTVIPYEEYVRKLILILEEEEYAPDVFLAGAENIGVFLESGCWEDLSSAPYKADVSDMFPYLVRAGKDSGGTLRALAWQAWIGGFYYRRSIAKQYLGTDDPEEVGEMLSTEEKFIATGLRLHEKSDGKIKLIPGWQDYMNYALAMRKKPFVTADRRFVLDDAVVRLFAVAKVLREQGLTGKYGMWSPGWFEAMQQDSEVFGYSLPIWGLNYVIEPNAEQSRGDWGVCRGPSSYFWGGNWLGINANSNNKQAAWEFVRFVTLNRETLEWWAEERKEFVNNKHVINKLKNEVASEYLAGQKYFNYLAAEASKIDGTLLSKYDGEIIYTLLRNAVNDYLEGRVSQKEAIKQFVRDVKDEFPELIME